MNTNDIIIKDLNKKKIQNEIEFHSFWAKWNNIWWEKEREKTKQKKNKRKNMQKIIEMKKKPTNKQTFVTKRYYSILNNR